MYDNRSNRVHIEVCKSYDEQETLNAVKACFNTFRVLEKVSGKNVLIKPNLLTAHRPEKAATTHPTIVAAAAKLLLEAGVADVVIGDSPGGLFDATAIKPIYRVTGMLNVARKLGVRLNTDFTDSLVNSEGNNGQSFRIASFITKADIIINISKLKTHTYMRMTAAVKNMYGSVPGLIKARYHAALPKRDDFANMLCDLCDLTAPEFSIIDGVVGMEGKGPGTGDPKQANVLIAAVNPYAADAIAANIISMNIKKIPVLVEALKRGYIPKDLSEIDVSGEDIKNVSVRFIPPPMMERGGVLSLLPGNLRKPVIHFIEPWPVIEKDCIGCGACAEACPKATIEIKNKIAVIEYKNCIKCYCCHEMCRYKAISLKRKLIV